MQIKAKDLTYSYSSSKKDKKYALKKVNLTIEEGDFFGIIGQTGSGKSTFVQHLNGLIKIGKDCGSISIGDYDLTDKKCDFISLRSKLGMVFQYPEYQLFAETVFEDVAFGLKNFNKGLTAEQIEIAVRLAIETVGLDYLSVKDKSPFELSGGQKRRVAIAGVIVSKPEILVLDEPVAGLDPKGKRDFIRLLHTLHNSFVKTIIIVSHDMNLVAENCNKIALFSQGEIIKQGSPKEVFSDERFIEKTGLSLPVTKKVENMLKEVGIIADSDLTEQDFIQKVIREFKGGAL